jgi:dolichol-phosphate mannosyltransferase
MKYSVILPTLNENNHIVDLINSISNVFKKKNLVYEIIIVDDNSVDGTIDTVENIKDGYNFLQLIVRKNQKKNLAQSINDGIKQSKYENIIWMDADFQHPPMYIGDLISNIDKHEAVICSRFLKKSCRYFNDEKFEKNLNENQSYIYNKLCKFFLFKDISDYTSGYICIKKKIFDNFKLKGYYGDYFVSLITYLKKKNYKIIEIPFKDEQRASGFSKTVVNINIKYIYTCFRYVITLIFNIFKK